MVEQPHARFYRGLPPVVRHELRRWLIIGAVAAPLVSLIVFLGVVLTQGYRSGPSGFGFHGGGGNPYGVGAPSWHDLGIVAIAIVVPLVVGGVFGMALARGWWSMVALDAVSLALVLAAFGVSGLAAWLFFVFGVSAGLGVRRLRDHRRVFRASFLRPPG